MLNDIFHNYAFDITCYVTRCSEYQLNDLQNMLSIGQALKVSNLRYFKYFKRKQNAESIESYLDSHPPSKWTVCVSYMQNYNGVVSLHFVIFKDWFHFDSVLQKIYPFARTFFNIFTSESRCFYVDIDLKIADDINYKGLQAQARKRGVFITNEIARIMFHSCPALMQQNNVLSLQLLLRNCWLFESCRGSKLSYHIVITVIKFNTIQTLQKIVRLIKCSLSDELGSAIDMSVYSKNYQLFRQPGSLKAGDPQSMMKLIAMHPSQKKAKLIDQIKINQCNACSLPTNIYRIQNSAPQHFKNSINSKVSTLIAEDVFVPIHIDQNIVQIEQKYGDIQKCSCSIGACSISTYRSMKNNMIWTEKKCKYCHKFLSFQSITDTNGRFIEYNPRIFANLSGTPQQIIHLHDICMNLKVETCDNFSYLFHKNQSCKTFSPGRKLFELKFGPHTRIPCPHRHVPDFIRSHQTCIDKYQIRCRGCNKFYG